LSVLTDQPCDYGMVGLVPTMPSITLRKGSWLHPRPEETGLAVHSK